MRFSIEACCEEGRTLRQSLTRGKAVEPAGKNHEGKLFVAQGHHRIHSSSALRRDHACRECHNHQ
jgi:hypothetical protein